MPAQRALSTRASSDIIAALRSDIASGRLPVGTRLPTETDLAAHYGVSKPTIREVIRSLDTMGLVEVRHGSGAYVRSDPSFLMMTALQLTMQLRKIGILEVLDVREALGRQSAQWAAVHHTDEDILALRGTYDELSEMAFPDLDALMDAIARFQESVAAMSQNALVTVIEGVLIRILLEMQFKAIGSRGLPFWRRRAAAFQDDRLAIIEAVASGDPSRAEQSSSAYHAHQREVFLADPELAQLILSDPAALRVADNLAIAFRQRFTV